MQPNRARLFRHRRSIAALSVLGIFATAAFASGERLPIRTYSAADGLPHNEINRIVRDSRGFLWFCTGDGLSRFDGYAFTNFTADQGLPPRGVNDLLETRDGRYWVATDGGLVRFNPGGTPPPGHAPHEVTPMFLAIEAPAGHPRARIASTLLQDAGGTIWVGTGDGLYRLAGADDRTLVPVEIGLPADFQEERYVSDIVQDRRGVLWIGTGAGLYSRHPDGSVHRYTVRDGLPDDYVHDLMEARDGRLWVATRGGGLFAVGQDAQDRIHVGSTYSARGGLNTWWVFQLFETADRHIWAATNAGLTEIAESAPGGPASIRTFTPAHGLSYHEVTAINEDAAGNLWLGTNTVGVMKMARDGFVTYGAAEDVASVNAVFEDSRGVVCFRGSPSNSQVPGPADSHTRFGCLDGPRADWFYPPVLSSPGWVVEHVTLRTRGGEWWIGTGTGLYRFDNASGLAAIGPDRLLAHYTDRNGLPGSQIFRLFEDSSGDVWASTISRLGGGLARWRRSSGTWTDLSGLGTMPSLRDELARSFAEDRDGHVWIGFDRTLVRFDRDGRMRTFGTGEGLPPGGVVEMITDHAGRVWFASSRSGLARIDETANDSVAFKAFTTKDGLSSNAAQVLVEDLAGRIYVGTGRALDRIDPETGRVKHFSTADGLAPGLFRAAYRDRTGNLWFGMTGGLSRFVPSADPPTTAPPVLVSGLVVGGTRRPVSALGETAISLPDLQPSDAQLQIEFVGLEFAPGETLRYRFRLDPQTEWSAPGDARSVNYANLPPGSYRFLVQAVSSAGVPSRSPASVSFIVLRPVWQRWWFMSAVSLLVAGLVLLAHRYRMRRLLEMVNLRTRIALDLHDDIGANLTSIAILSEVVRQRHADTAAEESVSSISRIARESVAAMSDIVWAINPQLDHVVDLARRMRHHAEELSRTHGIAVKFDAPTEDRELRLDAGIRRDLFLVFKEALNNACRHGQCSSVHVRLQVDKFTLSLEIADNGSGFDQSRPREGQGLTSMQHRAERAGGICDVESTPGRGTVVRVRVPAHGARPQRRRAVRARA